MSINTTYERPISLAILKECTGVGGENIISTLMEIERIIIQKKNITSIDGLDMCSQLKHADLSHNLISSLDPLILEIIPTLETLNISHNKLTKSINLSNLPKEHKLKCLNIAFNPIYLMEIDHLPPSLEILCVSEGQLSTTEKGIIQQHCQNLKDIIIISGEGIDDIEVQNEILEKIQEGAKLTDDITSENIQFDKEHNAIIPPAKQKTSATTTVKAKAPLAESNSTGSATSKSTAASVIPGKLKGKKSTAKSKSASMGHPPGKPVEILNSVVDESVLKKEQAVQNAVNELDSKLDSALNVVDEIDQAFLQIENLVETVLEGSRKRELDLFEALSKVK